MVVVTVLDNCPDIRPSYLFWRQRLPQPHPICQTYPGPALSTSAHSYPGSSSLPTIAYSNLLTGISESWHVCDRGFDPGRGANSDRIDHLLVVWKKTGKMGIGCAPSGRSA